jgi:hypothetical protein
MRKRKTCAQGSGLECLPLQRTTAFKACTYVVPACAFEDPPEESADTDVNGSHLRKRRQKFQGQKVTCMTAHRSKKKKETSVQRARRTAARHAIESRMPPVLEPQILQKTVGSLVSHCWTQENAAPNPKYPKN